MTETATSMGETIYGLHAGFLNSAARFPDRPALEVEGQQLSYAALEAAIRARHPYELPEIVSVPVTQGLPAYLDWVAAETAAAV